jgi:Domain of unknown function (DUF397)
MPFCTLVEFEWDESSGREQFTDLTGAGWRKSSFSSGNGGACVEVAIVPGAAAGGGSLVALRDSKNPAGPALVFTADEWRAFLRGVRSAH